MEQTNAHAEADKILEQLGGNRFIAMTGATYFMQDGGKLSFKVPHAAYVIALEADDTYRLIRYSVRTGHKKHEAWGVQVSGLREAFESMSGLRTSL